MNFWERNNFNGQNGGYGNQNGYGRNSSNNTNQSCGGCTEQDVRERMEQFNGKTEEQLMSELTAMVARMKSEGTFDTSVIDNLYATASPFLNEEQRQRMRAIVDLLKG